MKKLIIIAAVLALAGCDKQRDLYVLAEPLIYIEGNWVPSLGKSSMFMDATAIAYTPTGLYDTEYFSNQNNDDVTLRVEKGTFDVVIFNGLMFAEDDTHLNGVHFRGSDRLDTFEAVAMEATPGRRISLRSDDEYVASNNMEIFTSATERQQIEADKGYHLKYEDGKKVEGTHEDNVVEAELHMTPIAMSYECKVTLKLTNISSAWSASANLYGFVGSAFVASRQPSDFDVTHQFLLNSKKMLDTEDDIGTIESPVFVTFGPPTDQPGRKYEIDVSVTKINGEPEDETFDITEQLNDALTKIRHNLNGGTPVNHNITIDIEIEMDLPEVDPGDGSIGVGDWTDDEIIKVPIKPTP